MTGEIRSQFIRLFDNSGYTQTELAQLSGVAQPDISKYIAGKKNFDYETLQKVLRPLGYTIDPRIVRIK